MAFLRLPSELTQAQQGVIAVSLFFLALWFLRPRKYSASRLPGPRPLPFLGNVFDLNRHAPWTTFTQWKYQYGDVVGWRALGNNILVLNSAKAISDLLDKRGTNNSHRPIFTVSMPIMPYGPEWRHTRKLAHQALGPSAVMKYHGLQEDMAALLANEILDNPEEFFDYVRMAAGRIVLAVTYGISVKTADSEYITQADATMKMISESTVPGAYLCDLIPSMKYLPLWLPFQKKAVAGKRMIADFVARPFMKVKADMDLGVARPSLTQDLLANIDSNDEVSHAEYEQLVMWTTGSMYGAGGETTYSTVLNFIAAMALNPSTQSRAQAELDAVIGTDRMPTIADRGDLPYVNAVIKETMRWNPVLPLSIARRSEKADVYEGYIIPENTIIMPNSWSLAFEPNPKYPPAQFMPERFLDPDHPTVDPSTWAFGFGRRICPGKQLGENSVFIFITALLASLNFSEPSEGKLVQEFDNHLIRYPKPYKCIIRPRSTDRAELVRRRAAQRDI
ncbi:cytochrome P450 [Amylostereum chailletii]|nr:cytochrome P450 [Amylostereum chailletii]